MKRLLTTTFFTLFLVSSLNPAFTADQNLSKVISTAELLETFIKKNAKKSTRSWWISISGDISKIENKKDFELLLPNLEIFFKAKNGYGASVYFGNVKVKFEGKSDDLIDISVLLPSSIKFNLSDGTHRIKFGSSQIFIRWNTTLRTITKHKIELRDLDTGDKLADTGKVQLKKIAFISNIEEGGDKLWSGSQQWIFQDFIFRNPKEGYEIKLKNFKCNADYEKVQLKKISAAMRSVDYDGRFQSWYFGSLNFNFNGLGMAVTKDNVSPLLGALKKISVLRGLVNYDCKAEKFFVSKAFSIKKILHKGEFGFLESVNTTQSKGNLEVKGIKARSNEFKQYEQFLPNNIYISVNSTYDAIKAYDILPETIVDWANVNEKKSPGSSEKFLLKYANELVAAMAYAKSKFDIERIAAKNSMYSFFIKGQILPEPNSKGLFLGNLDLIFDKGGKIIAQLIKDAQKIKDQKFSSTIQKLHEVQKVSAESNSLEKVTYKLLLGNDGLININGIEFGPLISDDIRSKLTPLKKSREANIDNSNSEIKSSTPNKNQSRNGKLSLKKAKSECSDLGFKKGTEKYGDCVMKLID